MAPLASVESLETRLGRDLAGADLALAEAALEAASARVRHYGLPWSPANAPEMAVQITLDAAERKVRNPEGYRSEMLSSYQYALPASTPTGAVLTDEEIAILRELSGGGGLYSVPLESLGGSL